MTKSRKLTATDERTGDRYERRTHHHYRYVSIRRGVARWHHLAPKTAGRILDVDQKDDFRDEPECCISDVHPWLRHQRVRWADEDARAGW